jgi:hypothetical protein
MFMKPRPFPHETSRPCGAEFSGEELPREIERCQLPLVFNVKWWIVIVEEHSNDDPKKR